MEDGQEKLLSHGQNHDERASVVYLAPGADGKDPLVGVDVFPSPLSATTRLAFYPHHHSVQGTNPPGRATPSRDVPSLVGGLRK